MTQEIKGRSTLQFSVPPRLVVKQGGQTVMSLSLGKPTVQPNVDAELFQHIEKTDAGEKFLVIQRGKQRIPVPPGLYKIDWNGLKKDLDALS